MGFCTGGKGGKTLVVMMEVAWNRVGGGGEKLGGGVKKEVFAGVSVVERGKKCSADRRLWWKEEGEVEGRAMVAELKRCSW